MKVRAAGLKAHLSEHVRKAAGGEQTRVTDRGRPVAKLEGPSGTALLERGIAEGWITSPARAVLTPAIRYNASFGTLEAIDEDRG